MTPTATTSALHALLEGLIDYAGLFPPAGLEMAKAVSNYARYKSGPHAWMLGRFIVPVARLDEFERAWHTEGEPADWRLSALITEVGSDLPLIQEFNATYGGDVQIDAVELKASTSSEIRALPGITGYVEVASASDPTELIAQMKHEKLRAKIRTGGLTADAFPQAGAIARFLRACAAAAIPFKATAGLHHPVRCVKPFTYEQGSAEGTMHGFLNVFLAAGFARKGYAVLFLERLLAEENPQAFRFAENGVHWGDAYLSAEELADLRTNFAIAFGSCSFEEPIADLQALRLLP
ncbi:conserved hypothetical protein [Candidatus Koribacter versatilis Ellin345]|uniref:Uncharacterized protein n=1 Tax=Koribacter versatilis (strain Ellin345) TaxID=204669 RepID=Q1IQ43_KORVE|nr:hypothetical protein [Candidatus Koribacter versatilis]ABF41007.1 conserved hypothetical protein [Candidatus Koribacter versatilis Ellin345]